MSGLAKDLEGLVGKGKIISDREALIPYSMDESGPDYSHMPDAVVRATCTEDVSKVLNYAWKRGIPVTPRGAGSGLSGGAVPVKGGVVLSLEAMDRILDIDTTNMVCFCEAGVITNYLCQEVAKKGLFYAGYPMSVETSTIGGNVATNAGGSKVVKYGSTGNHVLGMEVVFPDGSICTFGGRRRKDSSGLGIHRLFVGSEGILGVITKVYLNLIPTPGEALDLLLPFKSLEEAVLAVPKMVSRLKNLPSSLELMDKTSAEISCAFNKTTLPHLDLAEAYLIVQFEEDIPDGEELYGLLKGLGALDVLVASGGRKREEVWKVRRTWLEALKWRDPRVVIGDVVVPTSRIPEMMAEVERLSKEHSIPIPTVGHVGDGNLHPAPLKPQAMNQEKWVELREEILDRLAEKAHELDGGVSGEHGIGLVKRGILYRLRKREVEFMKALKGAIDPKGIMNPGKVV